MTNNTLFTLKEGELLNYSDIHTHSSHLKDSQCFLFKDNKQNRSEAWIRSEDAEKHGKSWFTCCASVQVFSADLTRQLTKCINVQSSPTKHGISRSHYVADRKSDRLHPWSWRQKQPFESKARCFSHPDWMVFVPKPNQSVSRALWRDRNCQINLNKHKVR